MSGPIPPPAAEVDITESLVRALLRAQHADLADEPLEVLANGWDNVIVRLGEELLVRLPRRELASQLMHNEQRWLPSLAPMLPLPHLVARAHRHADRRVPVALDDLALVPRTLGIDRSSH